MKKVFLILSLCILIFITGCKESEEKREEPVFDKITYEFSGESENFTFKTGKVYFEGNTKRIYIGDFKKKSSLGKIKDITLSILFQDEEIKIESFDDNLSDIAFYEGDVCDESLPDMDCEITPFDLATEENFKDILKIKIYYCNSNECTSETFDIHYRE